jgi:hypothetical protein
MFTLDDISNWIMAKHVYTGWPSELNSWKHVHTRWQSELNSGKHVHTGRQSELHSRQIMSNHNTRQITSTLDDSQNWTLGKSWPHWPTVGHALSTKHFLTVLSSRQSTSSFDDSQNWTLGKGTCTLDEIRNLTLGKTILKVRNLYCF